MIDRATVDRIIDAARIVDVVGEFVTLRKSGVNYKGLCPFHDDRNPSFMVSPAKNICHCFVCGKGGTPAGFLMEHEQITYPEALRWLARKYNIEIVEKEQTDEERKAQNDRESMFIVNEWAMNWFHNILKNDPDGMAIGKQYFRSRGIRDDIIEKFQLGYAPQQRDALSTAAKRAGYQPEFLVKTGLCYEKDVLVDRYRGRAIFPWLNVSGKVVAFGGRVLDSRTKGVAQKYVNSPDSEIYHKERELYGIFQAKRQIVKEDRVFMVEGYTDVIAMHQAGIENVVANSGTALSKYQIRLLHRFTNNITLLYDGDEAGIHAAMRGTDMLLQEGMNIKVLLLPDGDDPDSFARKHSSEELLRYINDHQQDFITFKLMLTVERVSDPVKRSEAITGIVKSISVIPNPILRSTYIQVLSSRLGMKEQTLITAMNDFIREARQLQQAASQRQAGAAEDDYAAAPAQDAGHAAVPAQDASAVQGGGVAAGSSASNDIGSAGSNGEGASDAGGVTNGVAPNVAAVEAAGAEEMAEGGAPNTSATSGTPTAVGRLAPASSAGAGASAAGSDLEMLLMREVVRHGDEIIYQDVETDDGKTISLNVAQYIDLDLGQDGITFSNPLYRQMLKEAVDHSGDASFHAESYFTNHPDITVSQTAIRLAIDRHHLGGRFVEVPREGALRHRVVHLVMDLRMEMIERQLKDIQTAMRQANRDMERVLALMQQYKEMQELRNMLAKRLGNDVLKS